jgi:hypothetical protein
MEYASGYQQMVRHLPPFDYPLPRQEQQQQQQHLHHMAGSPFLSGSLGTIDALADADEDGLGPEDEVFGLASSPPSGGSDDDFVRRSPLARIR